MGGWILGGWIMGACRVAEDGRAKSLARRVGGSPPGDPAGNDGAWAPPYVRETCKLGPDGQHVRYLGALVGAPGGEAADVAEASAKAAQLREALADLNDAPVQLTLLRFCADVSKAMYALRCGGDAPPPESLLDLDAGLRRSVEHSLDGPLEDHSWRQAGLGVRSGGLGLRSASSVALCAYVASATAAMPLVAEVDDSMRGILPAGALTRRVQARLQAARDRLEADQPDTVKRCIGIELERATEVMQERWEALRAGAPMPRPPRSCDEGAEAHGGLFVGDAGLLDPEFPGSVSGPSLQSRLLRLLDEGGGLRERLWARAEGRWLDDRRLGDLQGKHVDHSWLWSLNPAHGPRLDASEYGDAVRLRLGASMVEGSVPCRRCGALVTGCGAHGLTCGGAGDTVGHNRVRDVVHALAVAADPASCLEPAGLIASRPLRRPADVFTHAATPDGCAALDVGITSPFVARGADDCVAELRRLKLRKAEPWLEELAREGVVYEPLAFSAFGRAEPGAAAIIERMVRRAARRAGLASPATIRRRTWARIGVELARRSVAVVRSCLPQGAAAGDELDDGLAAAVRLPVARQRWLRG